MVDGKDFSQGEQGQSLSLWRLGRAVAAYSAKPQSSWTAVSPATLNCPEVTFCASRCDLLLLPPGKPVSYPFETHSLPPYYCSSPGCSRVLFCALVSSFEMW